MAVIYLRHEIWGTKVATSDREAAMDERNGWERFDREAEAAAPLETPDFLKPAKGRKPRAD